jgi:hypothetical protein
VGPRAGLGAGARREILCSCRGSNPDRPARGQTLYCLSYHGSEVVGVFSYFSCFPDYARTVGPAVGSDFCFVEVDAEFGI